MNTADLINTREDYIELIKCELLGPGSEISLPDVEHELISDSPNTRYSIGILYPRENKMNVDNDDVSKVEPSDDEVVLEEETEIEIGDEAFVKRTEAVYVADEDNLDEEIGLAAQNMPSSMGITFFVAGDCERVNCELKFATYRKALADDCRIPFKVEGYVLPDEVSSMIYIDKQESTLRLSGGGLSRRSVRSIEEKDYFCGDEYGIISLMYKLSDQLSKGYVREPHNAEVCLDFSSSEYIDQNKELDGTSAKVTALRRKVAENLYSVTIMLVNDDKRKSSAKYCIYQPELTVYSEKNNFVFVEYAGVGDFSLLSDEEKSLLLQFRNKKVYGTGLGTSVSWEIDDSGNGCIYNDFFPKTEVPAMDFSIPDKYGVHKQTFSMKYLSDLSPAAKENKLMALESLVDAYDKWISEVDDKIDVLDEKFRNIAKKNMSGCKNSALRMHKGIEILSADKNAWDAFQLANRAMFMQRVHLKIQEETSSKNRYPNDEELSNILDALDYKKADGTHFWRPFQLAFLLMSICSITIEDSIDRELVDLIWFPTGGGKTEAYLGLTAFSIFYRKLQHQNEADGTAVIMRYTLRLLAAQQFTRASTLICACEYIRIDATSRRSEYGKYPLGEERITIGLWIGGDHTPNKNQIAKKELEKLMKSSVDDLEHNKDIHNKFQVLKCPWCGTKMVKDRVEKKMVGLFGYRMRNNAHFELFCPQESCFFNQEGRLPIQIVDEELYSAPPTLLFGTVDKFAMLPWNSRIGGFFGANSENRSPELIIQDELHLISGPLGTMVGLYEAAVDAICEQKGNKTKIIASTATIRKAAEQCTALYNRKVAQFPHPGIDAEDSFFARESVIDHPNGKYVEAPKGASF